MTHRKQAVDRGTGRDQCDIYHVGRRGDMTCDGITVKFGRKRLQPDEGRHRWFSAVTRWCCRILKGAARRKKSGERLR
ncbi:MAG: hypothetical protein ACE5HN_02035 [Nitrospiria bacterium]